MYKGSSQTCYKMELRNRILKAAMTEFLHKGVKSVKMDDIANTLAISKRTLYEIYSNKEELLLEAVRIHEQEFNDHMLQYSLDKNHNVMDIIIEFYKKKLLDIADVSPLFLVELRKYKQGGGVSREAECRAPQQRSTVLPSWREGRFLPLRPQLRHYP